VEDDLRTRKTRRQHRHETLATGDDGCVVTLLREHLVRLAERLRAYIVELRRFHGDPAALRDARFAGRISAESFAGVSGRSRAAPIACASPPVIWPATIAGCSTRPQSCMVTYLSMRAAPVTRSISTPQKSKMKPWHSDELISSFAFGAASCGGVQNTVSRIG